MTLLPETVLVLGPGRGLPSGRWGDGKGAEEEPGPGGQLHVQQHDTIRSPVTENGFMVSASILLACLLTSIFPPCFHRFVV